VTDANAAGAGGQGFRDQLVRELPSLRAFAASLCGSMQLADDLVQDTAVKAWSNQDKFQPGTSIRAWLFTILRNTYFSLYRKRGREVQDVEGVYSSKVAVVGGQESHIDLADFRAALAELPEEQREALVMIGASGLSYEEAAEISGVPVGTVKSRVNRARAKLAAMLSIEGADDFGPSKATAGVTRGSSAFTLD
jgi:RNA polymerase sigma-70 factor (ECF subfamily)